MNGKQPDKVTMFYDFGNKTWAVVLDYKNNNYFIVDWPYK